MAKPSQIKQVIKSYFENKKYSYNIEEKDTWTLFSGFKTRVDDRTAGLAIVYSGSDINASVIFSVPVTEEQFTVTAELLLRINRYLKRGHFFLDYKTGSVNFKMWHSSKGRLTVDDIDNMVLISIGSIETVMPILQQVLDQEISVEEGVKLYVNGGQEK